MNDLEARVARALRLSPTASELLSVDIQDNIATARAELIRSGVAESVVQAEGDLVQQAIVTYCLMNMNDEDKYDQYFAAFQYQQDNLRKSISDEE